MFKQLGCLVLLICAVYGQSSSSSSSSSANPSPLIAKLQNVLLNSPYPGAFDFELAAFSPENTTWYLPTDNDVLYIDWIHANCSNNAVPVFTNNDEVWNEPCDVGYDAKIASEAFSQFYAAQGISVPSIVYMYYPHIYVSVSGNMSKLVLVDKHENRTLGIVPNCAYHMMQGNNVLVSIVENGKDTVYTYFYTTIEPEDSIYLSAIASPFVGDKCFDHGEICWPLFCSGQN